jgi:hypothetical protein
LVAGLPGREHCERDAILRELRRHPGRGRASLGQLPGPATGPLTALMSQEVKSVYAGLAVLAAAP